MRERLSQLAGEQAKELTVGTFHSFCVRLLKQHGHVIGLARRFTICDASDQLSAVKSALRELRVHETTLQPSAVLARISLAKNRLQTAESFLEQAESGRDELVGSVWQRYREQLARQRTLDFDDLLLEAVRLLREHEAVREHYRRRYRYVLVDEYQDTNHAAVRARAPDRRRAPQRVRGRRRRPVDLRLARRRRPQDPRLRPRLPRREDRPPARRTTARRARSSTAANAVIRHNASRHDKQLESAHGPGAPLRLLRLKDETSEAQLVASEIRSAWARARGPPHFAVLCRTQVQFRPLEAELRRRGCRTPSSAACRSSTARRFATWSRTSSWRSTLGTRPRCCA